MANCQSMNDEISWKRDGEIRGYDSAGNLTYQSNSYGDGVESPLYSSSDIMSYIREAWSSPNTVRVCIEFNLPLEEDRDLAKEYYQ